MANGEDAGPIHPHATRRSGYWYCFYTKHHGREQEAAQWLTGLTNDEEFSIFDTADSHDLSDERQWLYGILRSADGQIRFLGTLKQQIAEYPFAREGEPWHGYPLWPVKNVGPPNRRGEKCRPAKEVLLKMEAVGLLTVKQRKRLFKGDHV